MTGAAEAYQMTMRIRGGVIVVGACLMVAALAAPARAEAERTIADLGWPATTRSAAAPRAVEIVRSPRERDRVGKLAKGTRVGWRRILAGGKKQGCRAWLELEPLGYACADALTPSDQPPEARAAAAAQTGPTRYADVRGKQADAYDTLGQIRAGTPARQVSGHSFVRYKPDKVARVGGKKYLKTEEGWIAEKRLRPLVASDFAGVDVAIAPPPQWPFAWVVPRGKAATMKSLAAPSRKAATVRELARRTVVPVLEEKKGYVRIADGEWLPKNRVRIARAVPPPAGVAADERWIDVDLEQQTLVAYQGATPVFATMVSSGKNKFRTPTGIYRISKKYAKTRMANPKEIATPVGWDVDEVPHAMKFRKYFALHGAYWHDGFGGRRSHGCVNLSPLDARWIFDFTAPALPPGWTLLELPDENAGTPVRIRNAWDKRPGWRNFAGEPLPKAAVAVSETPAPKPR